ncbi:MAG: hypothetical protein AAGD38_05415 [Acidobacteriota bacterium]
MSWLADRLDALVVGGGAAGGWILHRLRHLGLHAALVDSTDASQTANSQGILHRGTKYLLRPTANATDDFPDLVDRWHRCLRGDPPSEDPDLRHTEVLSSGPRLRAIDELAPDLVTRLETAYRLGKVDRDEDGYRFLEPIVDPPSLLANLEKLHASRWHRDPIDVAALMASPNAPCWLILAAGAGNQALLESLGFDGPSMIRQPLHMVWARGVDLPPTYCHMLDPEADPARQSAHWTVTSHRRGGAWSWYIGGDVTETERSEAAQHDLIRRLLERAFPSLDVAGLQLSSLWIDKAEPQPVDGIRRLVPFVHAHERLLTVWPMKLALVPQLADLVAEVIAGEGIA